MAAITAKDVAALRAQTGCGMMDCKKALVEAEGDYERAKEIIREYSMTRNKVAMTTDSLGRGLQKNSLEEEVTVGGATVFVMNVEHFEKV